MKNYTPDEYFGCPSYDGKSIMEMSTIELKGLLITLINDYDEERLKNLVIKLSNIHYSNLV